MSNFKIDFAGKKNKTLFEKKVKSQHIEYKGNPDIEADTEAELTELQKAFRKRAKDSEKEKENNVSTDFWSMIIFEDQQQRDEFYRLLGVKENDNQYINGKKLINALGLAIETDKREPPKKFSCSKDILEISIKPNFLT